MTSIPVLIAGAGPIGLACAISAKRRGFDPLVVDAGAITDSIVRYPVGMGFFTTPDKMEIGGHPLVCSGGKPTREEALKYFRGVARAEGLRVRTYARLVRAGRRNGHLVCRLDTARGSEEIECERLVLATGYFGQTNPLNVPGEDLPHVSHYFDEPHRSFGQDVVVVGGGNSGVEAALELYRAGARVTIVCRHPTLKKTIKYWLLPDIQNRIEAGEIAARFNTRVERIEPGVVVTGQERLPADRVYALVGFHPEFDLFRRIGITLDPETMKPTLDPATLETNVPGVYMAGSITAGRAISDVFIENGRFDGEKIFGNPSSASPSRAS